MFGENKAASELQYVYSRESREGPGDDVVGVGARNSARKELDPKRLEHQKTCYRWGRGGGHQLEMSM
jgi:hypothetical protein